jgi:hypothetical protein
VADHRHKRDTNARRLPRASLVAAPLALLVTGSAVALGVLSADPATGDQASSTPTTVAAASLSLSDLNRDDVSRSAGRESGSSEMRGARYVLAEQRAFERRQAREAARRATLRAIRNADTRLWTTEDLNLWSGPTEEAEKLGLLDAGKRVLVTGREQGGRTEVVIEGQARWVTGGYLSEDQPTPGIGGACTNGTSVSGGANVVDVHRAVCAAFPSITSYGTYRAGSTDHASGRAIDIMVSGSLGWEIAEFVRAHAGELGVTYVIYSQRIWSVDRAGEGWRGMSDRGSTTANHYDHVHVSTY